jgi:hypothetical protein
VLVEVEVGRADDVGGGVDVAETEVDVGRALQRLGGVCRLDSRACRWWMPDWWMERALADCGP